MGPRRTRTSAPDDCHPDHLNRTNPCWTPAEPRWWPSSGTGTGKLFILTDGTDKNRYILLRNSYEFAPTYIKLIYTYAYC